MDDATCKLIVATNDVDNSMNDYYNCDCAVHHTDDGDSEPAVRQCDKWLKFVACCETFMKLNPPFPTHEWVQTTASIADPNDRYFSDSTCNEFGASFDHYLDLIRYPKHVPEDNYQSIDIIDCANPAVSFVDRNDESLACGDRNDESLACGDLRIVDSKKREWHIMGFRINPNDRHQLQLLVESPDDAAALVRLCDTSTT